MASDELLSRLSGVKDDRLHFLLVALRVVKSAGKIVGSAYRKIKEVSGKGQVTDLVTATDVEVEKHIFDSLRKEFPSHCFIGEESVAGGDSAKLTDSPTWIVDPIDGTCNFVHMFPYVAVSIGLVINKRSEVGIVYAPILDDLYVAVRGEGSYLNGKQLKIENPPPRKWHDSRNSRQSSALATAVVACEWGASRDEQLVKTKGKNMVDTIIKHKIHAMRSTGSAALNMCLVACGSVDLYFEWGPHCWDVAAGSLIVSEAGGVNTTTKGEAFDLMGCTFLSAASRALIDELVPSLTQIEVVRDDA